MDNSPLHDEARWNEASRTLDCEDVGLNCLVCVDAEMLARMAAELGNDEATARYGAIAETLRKKIGTHFWDESRKIFASRLWSGKFVEALAPTSFYPLLAGSASKTQAAALLKHLDDPESFGGAFGLPSVARSHPGYRDNVYWRGRIWPILNWLVWQGLRRAGEEAKALELATKGWWMFERNWHEDRLCPENYNAETSIGLDQADTDGFYSWSALLPYVMAAEIMDFSPWHGWQIANGDNVSLGPVATPVGNVILERHDRIVTLRQNEVALLETNLPGRLTQVAIARDRLSLILPDGRPKGGWLRLALRGAKGIAMAQQGGTALLATLKDGMAELPLIAGSGKNRLSVLLEPD
jgi:putative isomerase